MAGLVAKKHGSSDESARKTVLAALVPGVIMQPSTVSSRALPRMIVSMMNVRVVRMRV